MKAVYVIAVFLGVASELSQMRESCLLSVTEADDESPSSFGKDRTRSIRTRLCAACLQALQVVDLAGPLVSLT